MQDGSCQPGEGVPRVGGAAAHGGGGALKDGGCNEAAEGRPEPGTGGSQKGASQFHAGEKHKRAEEAGKAVLKRARRP